VLPFRARDAADEDAAVLAGAPASASVEPVLAMGPA
jgi:hypothetical protein